MVERSGELPLYPGPGSWLGASVFQNTPMKQRMNTNARQGTAGHEPRTTHLFETGSAAIHPETQSANTMFRCQCNLQRRPRHAIQLLCFQSDGPEIQGFKSGWAPATKRDFDPATLFMVHTIEHYLQSWGVQYAGKVHTQLCLHKVGYVNCKYMHNNKPRRA